MTKVCCGSLLHLGGDEGCGEGASCLARVGPGFRCVLFCLQIRIEIKIFHSIKTRGLEETVSVLVTMACCDQI